MPAATEKIHGVLFWSRAEGLLALTSSLLHSTMHRERSCVILIVLPDFELLSGAAFPCGELL